MSNQLRRTLVRTLRQTGLLDPLKRLRTWLKYGIREPREVPLEQLFEKHLNQMDEWSFVQIGSNDGITNDPLRPFIEKGRCRGILVEPLPNAFQKLQTLYANNPHIILENKAIAPQNGTISFYTLDPAKADNRYFNDRISSISREHLNKHLTKIATKEPALQEAILQIDVQAQPLQYLLEAHHFPCPDVLCVDAEGFDWQVIQTLDWAKCQPAVILFEYAHLSPKEYSQALKTLRQAGYFLGRKKRDILALRNPKSTKDG